MIGSLYRECKKTHKAHPHKQPCIAQASLKTPPPQTPNPRSIHWRGKFSTAAQTCRSAIFCQGIFSVTFYRRSGILADFLGFKDSTKECQKSWLWSWSISSTLWLNQNMLVKLDQNKQFETTTWSYMNGVTQYIQTSPGECSGSMAGGPAITYTSATYPLNCLRNHHQLNPVDGLFGYNVSDYPYPIFHICLNGSFHPQEKHGTAINFIQLYIHLKDSKKNAPTRNEPPVLHHHPRGEIIWATHGTVWTFSEKYLVLKKKKTPHSTWWICHWSAAFLLEWYLLIWEVCLLRMYSHIYKE